VQLAGSMDVNETTLESGAGSGTAKARESTQIMDGLRGFQVITGTRMVVAVGD